MGYTDATLMQCHAMLMPCHNYTTLARGFHPPCHRLLSIGGFLGFLSAFPSATRPLFGFAELAMPFGSLGSLGSIGSLVQ